MNNVSSHSSFFVLLSAFSLRSAIFDSLASIRCPISTFIVTLLLTMHRFFTGFFPASFILRSFFSSIFFPFSVSGLSLTPFPSSWQVRLVFSPSSFIAPCPSQPSLSPSKHVPRIFPRVKILPAIESANDAQVPTKDKKRGGINLKRRWVKRTSGYSFLLLSTSSAPCREREKRKGDKKARTEAGQAGSWVVFVISEVVCPYVCYDCPLFLTQLLVLIDLEFFLSLLISKNCGAHVLIEAYGKGMG